MSEQKPSGSGPRPFSVVVPTFDRPAALRRCLEGFTRLEYPSWELIVVNDGGTRSFSSIDADLRDRLPLTLVDAEHRGPAAARNTGARAAGMPYLAFTDDDCVPRPDWLLQLDRGFTEIGASVLGGGCLNPYPANVPAATWQLYLDFLREYFTDASGNHLMLPSNNVAYEREAYWAVDGFDESYPLAAAEDFDLSYRIVERGYRQRYFEPALVWHHHRNTATGYLRQQFRYGKGTFDLRRRRYSINDLAGGRGGFYPKLMRFLRRRRAPWGVWFLILLTPIAHRCGVEARRFQAARARS